MSKTYNEIYFNITEDLKNNPIPLAETKEQLENIIDDEHELKSLALELSQKCILCGVILKDLHDCNNAMPLRAEGDCCSRCNDDKVIPARMEELGIWKIIWKK